MIERSAVEKLGELSMLKLSPEEIEGLTREVGSILDYISALSSVAAEDQAPVPGVVKNVLREDIVTVAPGSYTEAILSNAPNRKDNYIAVKKILS